MTENKIEEMLTSFNKRSSWLAQPIEHGFKCKYCDGNIRKSYKKKADASRQWKCQKVTVNQWPKW